MPDREVSTIRDLTYYLHATIIAKSALAASDGESRLRDRDDKKFYNSIPPLPGCFSVAKPFLWVGR